MTSITNKLNIDELKAQLHEALFLDLDDYGLTEQNGGEFSSQFLGLQLHSAFQPIYDSELGELYGHEALLRPSLGDVQTITPEFAFSFAEQSGRLVKFDRVCRTLHVLNFGQIYHENGLLFLNVHPHLLTSVNAHGKVFERILHANSVPTHRVVIEIQESVFDHDKQLVEAIDNYRDRGYRIAIDDFGRKQSNLDRLWKLSPDYVKLDLSIVQQAEEDDRVRRILPKLVDIIRDLGSQPVIEGIETQKQLDLAVETGSTLLQGFFLGRPVTAKELQPQKMIKPTIRVAA
jgi:EAL domain-containing protein (putative c-di-GMP-specific phosphodiesterase class I)